MSNIEFSLEQRAAIVEKLQSYFDSELDQELEQFDAEFLIDFFAKNIGAHFYNRGLHDARSIFESRIESIDDEIFAIEKDVF